MDVLVHGIRSALVPMIINPLLGRQHVDEFVETAVQKAPAAFQVLDQALRLVLGRNADLPDPGIDAVRQSKIDDPETAPERERGFGPFVGKPTQARAATARSEE